MHKAACGDDYPRDDQKSYIKIRGPLSLSCPSILHLSPAIFRIKFIYIYAYTVVFSILTPVHTLSL
jgi:hypothetical protein